MNALSEFHWLRPEWLWALLPLAVIAWRLLHQTGRASAWEKQCDPHLLAALLIRRAPHHRLPLILLMIGWTLAVAALAGPAWQKLPQPVYRTQAAHVIVLDLSPSMEATDLRPSRIARARFKVLDLLSRYREGQTALVVFAGEPFVVSPLTDDTKTIAALVPPLSPELMPAPGDHAHSALRMADELLSQAGIQDHGEIVLITDGYDDPAAALEAVKTLNAHGRRVSVLGVGTTEGAPIPLADGGFLKDATGAIAVPRLDPATLSELAHQGGGRYVPLSTNDQDIDALSVDTANSMAQAREVQSESSRQSMDRWREEGPWLVLILLPLAALAFRRGWFAVLLLGVLIVPDPASASDWRDWWARPDQQGMQALQAGEGKQAAELFQDPAWKGSAQYRAGNYEKALENFKQSDSADALYNRGNALAHLGQLQEAIAAYDQALKQNPDNTDARHNKALVEKLLEQQQQQSGKDSKDQQSGKDSKDSKDQQSGKDSKDSKDQQSGKDSKDSKDQQSGKDSKDSKDQQSGKDSKDSKDQQTPKNSSADQAKSASADQKNDPKSQEKNQSANQQQHPENGKPASQSNSTASTPKQPKTEEQHSTSSVARSEQPKPDEEKDQARQSAETKPAEPKTPQDSDQQSAAAASKQPPPQSESQQAMNQWLQRIPDDPGGLLRRKFWVEHMRRQQQATRRGE